MIFLLQIRIHFLKFLNFILEICLKIYAQYNENQLHLSNYIGPKHATRLDTIKKLINQCFMFSTLIRDGGIMLNEIGNRMSWETVCVLSGDLQWNRNTTCSCNAAELYLAFAPEPEELLINKNNYPSPLRVTMGGFSGKLPSCFLCFSSFTLSVSFEAAAYFLKHLWRV